MSDFPIYTFPSNTVTDGNYLYRSLGSFWNNVFQEQGTIKGYTLGNAEELIQRYYDLLEVINSYSVDNIDVFHKEKWQPLIMYKSKFDRTPFVFEQDNAVFGAQPDSDQYYQNIIFQFGVEKTPISDVYIYNVGSSLTEFSVIADKIFSPSSVFVYGTDTILSDGDIYFNTDIFDNPNIPRAQVIGENGIPVTYTDSAGNIFNEELVILWIYNAKEDVSSLYYNFGYLFELNLTNNQYFKDILKAIFSLYVDGPTVNNIKSICSAFMGVSTIINPSETVQYLFSDANYNYVVTDLECYRISDNYDIASNIQPGVVLNVGDLLISDIQYFDNTVAGSLVYYAGEKTSYGWWQQEGLIDKKLAFSKYLFYGDYLHQLLFSTVLDVITLDANGNIVFPVEGDPNDIITFNNYLNDSSRQSTIKTTLGLVNPGDAYPTIPLNFVMENFLKTNTAMLKFNFYSDDSMAVFLNLLPIIKNYIPPYIYLILKITLAIPVDNYSNLNDSINITFDSGTQLLNSDGSDDSGNIAYLSPYYYNNVASRLFELSLGVKASSTADLPYDYVVVDPESVPDGSASGDGRIMSVTDGQLLRAIPPRSSSSQYGTLLFLDFS